MIQKYKQYAAIPLALLALFGCNKDVTQITGRWVISFVDSLRMTTSSLPTLCNPGQQTVLDISGTVDRDFYRDGHSSPYATQLNSPLVMGNKSSNSSYLSTTQKMSCDDLSVGVWNRSYLAVTLLGASTDGYAKVTTDPAGNCIVTINNARTSKWVTLVVSYPGNENIKTVNGTQYSDANNRQSAFTVNCDNNSYIQQLSIDPSTKNQVTLKPSASGN